METQANALLVPPVRPKRYVVSKFKLIPGNRGWYRHVPGRGTVYIANRKVAPTAVEADEIFLAKFPEHAATLLLKSDRRRKPACKSVAAIPGIQCLAIPSGPCVYFLIRSGVVVYVGQSINLLSRLGEHIKYKKFDGICYLPCPRKHLNRVEAAWIHKLRPELNHVYPALEAAALAAMGQRKR